MNKASEPAAGRLILWNHDFGLREELFIDQKGVPLLTRSSNRHRMPLIVIQGLEKNPNTNISLVMRNAMKPFGLTIGDSSLSTVTSEWPPRQTM